MDNFYLQELINETISRGGGLLLNFEDKPAVVVLTVEKYNNLVQGAGNREERIETQEQKLGVGNYELTGQDQVSGGDPLPLDIPKPNQSHVFSAAKKVLVTGGAGYIGGHLVFELIKAGYEVVVLDNLSTGKKENINPKAIFVEGDLADENLLKDIFATNQFTAVFHMAASLEVGESVREPAKYLRNNVSNTIKLLEAMAEANVKKIIFSSTASVYGEAQVCPIIESSPLHPNNPYGSSKLLAERAIKFFCEYLGFSAVVFRYFNACGFDPEANILPTHQSHLIYNVLQVAKGSQTCLEVYGNDYDTFDGTGIRDYVHVSDIVLPHILALEKTQKGFEVFNIGTGKGFSVAQVVAASSELLNKIIPMQVVPRRPGDAPSTVADNTKLLKILGYNLQFSSLENMVGSSWEVMKDL